MPNAFVNILVNTLFGMMQAIAGVICKLDDPDAKKDLEWAHADLVATQILVSHRYKMPSSLENVCVNCECSCNLVLQFALPVAYTDSAQIKDNEPL